MDSSMLTLIGGQMTDASDGLKSLLTTFLPIACGLAVLAVIIRKVPSFISRLGRRV
jgi:hypothetical protein